MTDAERLEQLATLTRDMLFSPAHSSGDWACECHACEAARQWMRENFGEKWYTNEVIKGEL